MKESIIVDCANKGATINPDIYGHFAEHLGSCIYGGFWVGKNSDIPNIHGFNKAVVEAFKNLDIPNLRWPGGCFADTYHWQDGIGKDRKKIVNTVWGDVVEDNSFGTHEFLELCDELKCKPYICGNLGTGSAKEMSEWVEYITNASISPMADLRRANGREEPWKLPFFGVGNESWGYGGFMRPDYYTDLYLQYQTFLKQYSGNKMDKIAVGPNGADYEWTDKVMQRAHKFMNGFSLHYYTIPYSFEEKLPATGFSKEDYYRMVRAALYMEELVRRHDEIMSKYDPEKKISLVVDEWGNWFAPKEGTNPGFLVQDNSVSDAIVAGVTLNIFNNHADRVRMANLAQAVNVLQSPVLTQGDKIVLTPTYHVLHQYKKHMNGTLLSTTTANTFVGVRDVVDYNAKQQHKDAKENVIIPDLNVSASVKHCDKCGKDVYCITVVNTDIESSRDVAISLANFAGNIAEAEATVVTGDSYDTINYFDSPERVTEKAHSVKVTERDTVEISLPAHSVACITVKA